MGCRDVVSAVVSLRFSRFVFRISVFISFIFRFLELFRGFAGVGAGVARVARGAFDLCRWSFVGSGGCVGSFFLVFSFKGSRKGF